MKPENVIKPGYIGGWTDARRAEFDVENEMVLTKGTQVDVIFIGDSVTQAWGDLNVYFGEAGFVLNRGIAGDSTSGVVHRFEADVLQFKPRYCVILIGYNDTWALDENVKANKLDFYK